MNIETFTLGPLGTNAYLITNTVNGESIVIDPGVDPDPLLKSIKNKNVRAILLTHAHFDHIGGLDQVRKVTGSPVYIHPSEQQWLTDGKLNGSTNWFEESIETDKAEFELNDGELLTLAGMEIMVMHTPGHSPGGVSFLIENDCFSGDALFAGSIGRTDLSGGNYQQLIASIQDKLMVLSDDVGVYPGHGPETTIGQEKDFNPFITGLLR